MRTVSFVGLCVLSIPCGISCRTEHTHVAPGPSPGDGASYTVRRIDRSFPIDGSWEKSPWDAIDPLAIARHMGEGPLHRPRTQVKVAYDDQNLYVIFRVEDRYVRATVGEHCRSRKQAVMDALKGALPGVEAEIGDVQRRRDVHLRRAAQQRRGHADRLDSLNVATERRSVARRASTDTTSAPRPRPRRAYPCAAA